MTKQLIISLLLVFPIQIFAQDTTSVYFDSNSHTLNSSAAKIIKNRFSRNQTLKSIIIIGYTDREGTPDDNMDLGTRRASAVQKLLAELIPKKNQWVLLSLGETEAASQIAATDRRVDIITNRKKDTVSASEIKPIEALTESAVDSVKESGPKLDKAVFKVGEKIRLADVHFRGGLPFFMPSSFPVLEELYVILDDHPTMRIDIQGHICCNSDGREGRDLSTGLRNLSVSRAQAVYNYLIKKGIKKKRLTYQGFASKHLIIKNEETEEDRTTNRRVEIEIISQ